MSAARRVVALISISVAGCASDPGQYAFAPPLAPPVYPQPAGYATPVVGPAPSTVASAAGIPAAPGPTVPPGTVMATASADPCAGVIPAGVVVETPCPDAGTVLPDGAVVVTGMSGDACCDGEVVVR